jgi:hypothetical protein
MEMPPPTCQQTLLCSDRWPPRSTSSVRVRVRVCVAVTKSLRLGTLSRKEVYYAHRSGRRGIQDQVATCYLNRQGAHVRTASSR